MYSIILNIIDVTFIGLIYRFFIFTVSFGLLFKSINLPIFEFYGKVLLSIMYFIILYILYWKFTLSQN
jgi:hypothetical protein